MLKNKLKPDGFNLHNIFNYNILFPLVNYINNKS